MKAIKQEIYKAALGNQGKIMEHFKRLNEWQWLSEQEVKDLQRKRLTDLLLHAYQHVPYYRKILRESGVVKHFQVDLNRFKHIEMLDKDRIREHFQDLKSDDLPLRKWYTNTSGGSTGVPVRFIQDQDYNHWSLAVKLLDDRWTGRDMCDKQVLLWGSERDLLIGKETWKTNFARWIKNEKHLNSFRMSEDKMLEYVETINQFKPEQILAYVESIYQLAMFVERRQLALYRPKSIMTSAGTLFDSMRAKIEQVFGAPVFNRYGSREVGDIACECERHKGLHVSSPTHIVEIVRDNGEPAAPGEIGEIVVTLLTNHAMPLIRYRIGDMGSWAEGPCDCGRNYPLIKELTGRVTDTFVTGKGTQVHGEYFTHLFYFQTWVKKFQVIQEYHDQVRVLLVPVDPYPLHKAKYDSSLEDIRNKIKLVMGDECRVFFEMKEEIMTSPSGKYRYTISNVASRHLK